LKFLIACALIGAMCETAVAQRIPEKCQNLHVTNYEFKRNNDGNPSLYALIHNDDPYNVTLASFYFDLLIDQNFKIGEGSVSIGRLMHGDTEKVFIYYTTNQNIQGAAIDIRLVSIYCNFSS
jgi:hypothetical protein